MAWHEAQWTSLAPSSSVVRSLAWRSSVDSRSCSPISASSYSAIPFAKPQ